MQQATVLSISSKAGAKHGSGQSSDKSHIDLKLADAFRSMESPLSNLRCMAQMLTTLLDDGMNAPKIERQEAEMLLFGAYHLREMIESLERDWHDKFDASKEV